MARPTDGTCKAVVAWRIDKGHFGDTKLDGLLAVNTYSWLNPIHEGNGTMQTIIDERADQDQRDVLTAVMQGEGADPGSNMLQIYRSMCTTWYEPVFRPIEIDLDLKGRTARLSIPGLLDTTVEPLKNPVTGVEWRARIDLPNGKEVRLAEVGSGTTKATGLVPLEFANSHAHFADSTFSSDGIIE